jgi:hypothetical protein
MMCSVEGNIRLGLHARRARLHTQLRLHRDGHRLHADQCSRATHAAPVRGSVRCCGCGTIVVSAIKSTQIAPSADFTNFLDLLCNLMVRSPRTCAVRLPAWWTCWFFGIHLWLAVLVDLANLSALPVAITVTGAS